MTTYDHMTKAQLLAELRHRDVASDASQLARIREDIEAQRTQMRLHVARLRHLRRPGPARAEAAGVSALQLPSVTVDHSGRIVTANAEAHRMLGSPDLILGSPMVNWVAVPDRDVWAAHWRQCQAGVTRAVSELMLQSADQRFVPAQVFTQVRSATRDDSAPYRLTFTDLTYRNRAQREILENEAMLRGMFSQAAVGMARTGPDGRFTLVNRKLCEMLGYGEREMLQLRLDDVIVTRMQTGVKSTASDAAFTDGQPQEVVARRGDRTHLWVQITASRLQVDRDAGADRVHVIEDVSARKAAEDALAREHAELERRVEQLRHFATQLATAERRERVRLAGLLHDHLQQLLVAAKMHVEYTQNMTSPETRQHGLERAKHLLEQCIDASRSLTLELSPPVLRHDGGLIPALQWLRDWMLSTHGLAVQLKTLAAAEPADVDLRALLFEAVRELLFNVVKHARVASATVTLARATDGTIVVGVHDEGTGFDAAEAAAAPSKSFGLFSLRERLDVFGANLVIDAVPGRGTSIEIRVPDRVPAVPRMSHQEAVEPERKSMNSSVRSDR